jgi:hypothetical protein
VVLGHGLVQAFATSLPIRGFIHGLDKPMDKSGNYKKKELREYNISRL